MLLSNFFPIINKDAINIFVHTAHALEESAVLEFGVGVPLLYFVKGGIMTFLMTILIVNHFH